MKTNSKEIEKKIVGYFAKNIDLNTQYVKYHLFKLEYCNLMSNFCKKS